MLRIKAVVFSKKTLKSFSNRLESYKVVKNSIQLAQGLDFTYAES
jgi:hypothetical protein